MMEDANDGQWEVQVTAFAPPTEIFSYSSFNYVSNVQWVAETIIYIDGIPLTGKHHGSHKEGLGTDKPLNPR